jgi:hypothetical protein
MLPKSLHQTAVPQLSGLLVVLLALLLVACDGFEAPRSCLSHYAIGDRSGWQLDGNGIALHLASGTRWYRCPAGMTWAANRCQGQALRSTWDDAIAYAAEFSEKSGLPWVLPGNRQFSAIQEEECNNPSMNPQVLGSIEVDNYWTATRTLHNAKFRCTLYTFAGDINCREPKDNPHPFYLMLR